MRLIQFIHSPLPEQTLSPCYVPATVLGAGGGALRWAETQRGVRALASWKQKERGALLGGSRVTVALSTRMGTDFPGKGAVPPERRTAWAKATESQLEEVQEKIHMAGVRGAERWARGYTARGLHSRSEPAFAEHQPTHCERQLLLSSLSLELSQVRAWGRKELGPAG